MNFKRFLTLKLSTMGNLQYKNIVKCIGNYNDYNVTYCKIQIHYIVITIQLPFFQNILLPLQSKNNKSITLCQPTLLPPP